VTALFLQTRRSGIFLAPGVPPEKRRNLVPVPAARHRTPSSPVCSRIIVEKQPALRVRAAPDRRVRTLHQKFRRGPGDSRNQPFQTAFPRHKPQAPRVSRAYQLVVAFGNPKNLVDRFHPNRRERSLLHHSTKNRAHRFSHLQDVQQRRIHRLRLTLRQRPQPRGPLLAYQLRSQQERHKLIPRKVPRRRNRIGKIQSQSARHQLSQGKLPFSRVTALPLRTGYNTLPSLKKVTFETTPLTCAYSEPKTYVKGFPCHA